MKNILLILVALVLIGGAYYVLSGKSDNRVMMDDSPSDAMNMTDEDETVEPDRQTSTGFRAEESAVVATEQKPGNSVIMTQVFLAAPGYVVIHEDSNGKPGAAVGVSGLLPAGESTNVQVMLTQSTKDGETLWSMLHVESSNNSTYDDGVDMPVESRLGGPIMGQFDISATADTGVQVSI